MFLFNSSSLLNFLLIEIIISTRCNTIDRKCANEKINDKMCLHIIVLCFVTLGFQIYPPPTTPPEPAPPDHHMGPASMMRPYKGHLVSASQSSLDDITCKPMKKATVFIFICLYLN